MTIDRRDPLGGKSRPKVKPIGKRVEAVTSLPMPNPFGSPAAGFEGLVVEVVHAKADGLRAAARLLTQVADIVTEVKGVFKDPVMVDMLRHLVEDADNQATESRKRALWFEDKVDAWLGALDSGYRSAHGSPDVPTGVVRKISSRSTLMNGAGRRHRKSDDGKEPDAGLLTPTGPCSTAYAPGFDDANKLDDKIRPKIPLLTPCDLPPSLYDRKQVNKVRVQLQPGLIITGGLGIAHAEVTRDNMREQAPPTGGGGVSDKGKGKSDLEGNADLVDSPDVRKNIAPKIGKQMVKRGWTTELIDETIRNPAREVPTVDTRWKSDGTSLNDPATAYVDKDGNYVVRSNTTNDIVQISDRTDPDWKSPF